MPELVSLQGPGGSGAFLLHRIDGFEPRLSLDRDGVGTAAPGHARLVILDLSTLGHQPVSTLAERFWIAYKGKIYHHQDLRQELETLGQRCKLRNDTEVILAAFARWRTACLNGFKGMSAFVLVDQLPRQVCFARDHFGVKLLYYWRSDEMLFVFASQINQFCLLCLNMLVREIKVCGLKWQKFVQKWHSPNVVVRSIIQGSKIDLAGL